MSTQSEENQPVLPDVVPAVAVDNVANAKAFQNEWQSRQEDGNPTVSVSLPGTNRSVDMGHVEVTANVISVWTSTDHTLPPDFVLVNAPTSVPNDHGIMVEDPMTAIALAIDGATN